MTKKQKILIAACAVGVMNNGGMIISPALASIMESFSGVPEMLLQMLITIPALMMVPSSIISSNINRRCPSKRIFEGCLFMLALAGILPYVFQYFPLIFASRIIVGISIGAMIPLANSMITNTYSGHEKDWAIGIFTAVGSLSGACMVYFSGVIVRYGWKYNFLIYLLAIIELIVVVAYCPKYDEVHMEKESKDDKSAFVVNKVVIAVWIIFFVYMGFLNTFPPNIALFIQGEKLGTNTLCGLVSAVFLISGFVSGLVYSKLTALFKRFTLALGLGITALGIVVVSGSYNAWEVITGSCIAGFGMGITLPTGNLAAAASVFPADSATAIAISSSGYQVAQFMTTFLVTPLATTIFGAGVIRGRFQVSAIVLCIWAVMVFCITGVFRNKQRAIKEESER